MVARVYSVDNKSLPDSLTYTKAGDLIVMLKSALTTGYNAKPHAGWKLVYDSITNSNDTVRRAVFQSQAPSSEQRYYEIVDDVTQGQLLKMHEYWDTTNLKGYGRSVSLYVYGNNGNRYIVIANNYFCIFQWGSKSYFLGDFTPFTVTNNTEQSIIMGQADTNNQSFSIPANNSTKFVYSRKIININNDSLVLRNEHAGFHNGWSNAISWNDASTFYGTGDNEPFIKPIDILRVSNNQARYYGTLPIMYFSSKNPYELVIAENGQKILARHFTHSEELLFLVDEL